MNKNWWLYALKLEEGKYYVGITSQSPEKRFWEHKNKVRAAYWTMKYLPIEIIHSEDLGSITKEQAEAIENKKVRELLKKHGVNNVRGGDIKDTRDYVRRFGWLWIKEDWQVTWWALYVLIVLVVFFVDKYIYAFIPGGVR